MLDLSPTISHISDLAVLEAPKEESEDQMNSEGKEDAAMDEVYEETTMEGKDKEKKEDGEQEKEVYCKEESMGALHGLDSSLMNTKELFSMSTARMVANPVFSVKRRELKKELDKYTKHVSDTLQNHDNNVQTSEKAKKQGSCSLYNTGDTFKEMMQVLREEEQNGFQNVYDRVCLFDAHVEGIMKLLKGMVESEYDRCKRQVMMDTRKLIGFEKAEKRLCSAAAAQTSSSSSSSQGPADTSLATGGGGGGLNGCIVMGDNGVRGHGGSSCNTQEKALVQLRNLKEKYGHIKNQNTLLMTCIDKCKQSNAVLSKTLESLLPYLTSSSVERCPSHIYMHVESLVKCAQPSSSPISSIEYTDADRKYVEENRDMLQLFEDNQLLLQRMQDMVASHTTFLQPSSSSSLSSGASGSGMGKKMSNATTLNTLDTEEKFCEAEQNDNLSLTHQKETTTTRKRKHI